MTEQDIKAALVKAMDQDVPDPEAQAAVAGVVARAAFNLERIATALEGLIRSVDRKG
ncbi:hypothetical protein IVA87_33970 [Bradyrhizobium sp. 147]|uniref:hypothetical protein n=1 Tax=Bradyrhizobium sp. 147 TaxID=2782623 RepID=UPI001FFBC0C5|nr:hypothetical protein [Bradyrhizobium sp. 147]MCK1684262.1 hypothetical protein [Bradyrhizobium sp. 147]